MCLFFWNKRLCSLPLQILPLVKLIKLLFLLECSKFRESKKKTRGKNSQWISRRKDYCEVVNLKVWLRRKDEGQDDLSEYMWAANSKK